jgi:TRAP-type C4-dicarboxylate transport system permease small subunit
MADGGAAIVALISRATGVVAAATIFIIAVITSYEVLMRYFLNRPTVWVTETSGYLLIVATVFGAVYTLYWRGHINIVLLYRRFPPRVQAILAVATSVLALLFVAALVWQGWEMTIEAYQKGGTHIGDMFVPQWVTFQLIPVGGALLGLELLRQLYENLVSLGRR